MNKVVFLSMVGSFARQIIVYAVAKLGLGAFITDGDSAKIAEVAVLLLFACYSAWSKRKAILAVPPAGLSAKTSGFVGCFLPLGLVGLLALGSGCAVIHGKAGASSYVGLAFGEKASAQLAGLNITETETKTKAGVSVFDRGVGLDKSSASGEADMGKILGNLLLLGLQAQGLPALPAAATQTADEKVTPEAVATAPPECDNCTFKPKP